MFVLILIWLNYIIVDFPYFAQRMEACKIWIDVLRKKSQEVMCCKIYAKTFF